MPNKLIRLHIGGRLGSAMRPRRRVGSPDAPVLDEQILGDGDLDLGGRGLVLEGLGIQDPEGAGVADRSCSPDWTSDHWEVVGIENLEVERLGLGLDAIDQHE